MDNFGVIELASTKTTSAPGWAYVADTGGGPSSSLSAAVQPPPNRKRAARIGKGLSLSDQSARQEARLRKELEALDREGGGGREGIPVPARKGGEFLLSLRRRRQSWAWWKGKGAASNE